MRPLEEDAKETQQPVLDDKLLPYDSLADDLKGAVDAEGEEEVENALAQVERGEARPLDLLHWIDEVRDPEAEYEVEEEPAEGFMHDFEYDSEVGDSNMIDPDAVGDAQQAAGGTEESSFDDSADADYVFSAVKRRNVAEDDDDEPTDDDKPKTDEKKPDKKKSKKA